MITCEGTASGTPTIMKNLTDANPYSKTYQLALTLLQSDGVLPGTSYKCYAALAIDSNEPSGRSPPAYVTTPANSKYPVWCDKAATGLSHHSSQ